MTDILANAVFYIAALVTGFANLGLFSLAYHHARKSTSGLDLLTYIPSLRFPSNLLLWALFRQQDVNAVVNKLEAMKHEYDPVFLLFSRLMFATLGLAIGVVFPLVGVVMLAPHRIESYLQNSVLHFALVFATTVVAWRLGSNLVHRA